MPKFYYVKRNFNDEIWGYRGKQFNLHGTTVKKEISARFIDEYPILFVAASFANGTSSF